MPAPPIPREVQAILDWWLPRVRGLLAAKLKAVALHGSAAIGDFMPGWSDVDVCVVLDDPVTEEQGARIGALHDEMAARYIQGGADGWRSDQAIEGQYVPVGLAADPEATAACYVAGGTTRRWSVCHAITPFDRYMLARFGRTVRGTRVQFAAPSPASLAHQARKDLQTMAEPDPDCLESPIWLAGIMHWLARSIVFWCDGTILSKTEALEREIAGGSAFASAFERALELRREGSAACAGRLMELRDNFLAVAAPASELLGELVHD